ncbi:hypothetical protein [Xenorhabdus bovienii]|uniref:hypothetical protein n=1 Tax=Xenorhabdus bovienii TaxID=40576 RepID=UPI0023B21F21|nr:hypothetical protein [Xenorhabdus bovienii]MDE9549279.1 hypothetical protein [Xenorhabdus bovienii]
MKLLKFNDEMLQLVISGQKTQTRRPIDGFDVFEPYETGFWRVHGPFPRDTHDEDTGTVIPAGTYSRSIVALKHLDWYCPYGRTGDFINFHDANGYPIGKIMLDSVRADRLQNISAAGAKAEGLAEISKDGKLFKFGLPDMDGLPGGCDIGWQWSEWEKNPVMAYKKLWASIYGKDSWDNNPWVWVIEFRRINNEQ